MGLTATDNSGVVLQVLFTGSTQDISFACTEVLQVQGTTVYQ